jgi:dephospho-CoA kinase
MPFIGLTGGIGTGKTTVLNYFKNLGAFTLNADSIVHELLKNPAMINKLSRVLGKDILIKKNNRLSISKNRMADAIFTNTRKRRFAEKTIHPEVIKTALNKKTKIQIKKPNAVIVFEVPLLFEAGYKNIFDKIIVVYCDRKTALERLTGRGISKEQVLKRMRAQLPLSRKKYSADFLINNNSTIRNLKNQVQIILKKLTQ